MDRFSDLPILESARSYAICRNCPIPAALLNPEPLELYRAGNQLMGHRIDLGRRINGSLKVRRSSFF